MGSATTKMSLIGIGGAGCNTINRLSGIEHGVIPYVNTVAIDTDEIELSRCKAKTKILIGEKIMNGTGSGGKPENGKRAAKENEAAIKEAVKDSDIVFLTAGFGGGTGSGASGVVAQIAKALGIKTIVAYIMPFTVEGEIKMNNARRAVDNISKIADAYYPIDNEKMLHNFPQNISANDAFYQIDDIIRNLIKSILFDIP